MTAVLSDRVEDTAEVEEIDPIDVTEELAKFIFTSKYARYDSKLQRRETWDEAVDRVQSMHLKKFKGDKLTPAQRAKIRWAFDMVREKKVLSSMRSMQYGGLPIEKNNERGYNCAVRHIDSLRSFSEVFYLLLCGCGVGLGLTKKYVDRIPNLVTEKDRTGTTITYIVQDDIEGWADSVEILLMCYTKNNPFSGRTVAFDYSKIRPKGSPIKTSGGKAPGYVPLKNAHRRIKNLLSQCVEEREQEKLRPIDVYDILMHTADSVISGGRRRSATITIFDKDDEEMLNAKTGNWFEENPQRARSNNSVLLLRNDVSLEEFKGIVERTREFGEPAYVFADHEDTVFNPCLAADQRVLTEGGWRSFEELLGANPVIHQDSRFVSPKEGVWEFTGGPGGSTILNQASDVRQTGRNRQIYKLTLSCGREVRATGNHHFGTPNGMVQLADLLVGDRVLIGVPEAKRIEKDSQFDFGFIVGLVAGDGYFSAKDHSAIIDMWDTPGNEGDYLRVQDMVKSLLADTDVRLSRPEGASLNLSPQFNFRKRGCDNYAYWRLFSTGLFRMCESIGFTTKNGDWSWLHKMEESFKAGFISGLFYADGSVQGPFRCVGLGITQSNLPAIKTIQLVLQELGIFSQISLEHPEGETAMPDGRGGTKTYFRRASFRLSWYGKENLIRSFLWLDLWDKKRADLDRYIKTNYGNNMSIIRGARRYDSKVVSITEDGVEDVYCLTENINRTMIVQGITTRRCVEVGFLPTTKDGRTGVQFCNLSTINGTLVKTAEDYFEAVEAAAIIGTLQATYTDFPYLNAAAKELTEEEALLGVSMTGMMEQPDILLDPVLQQQAAKVVVDTNREWAEILGVNQAARCTLAKPEGSGSLAVGTMAAGIHPAHDHWMFRRVQCNKIDPVYEHFKKINPHMVEESVWSANESDDVITFPIRVSDETLVKDDLDALSHLSIIKSTQENWVLPGTTEANQKPVTHNISCTVRVKPEEWEQVTAYLYRNREFFSGVSLFPADGDKTYAQAPVESIATGEEFEKFHYLRENMKPVDYTILVETEDATELLAEASCFGGACLT